MRGLVGFSRLLCVVVCAVGFLAGCATTSTGPADPAQDVTKRAEERWKILVAGDLDRAYAYLSPGARAVLSVEGYKAKISRGFWRGAKVESAECADKMCKVAVLLDYTYRRSRAAKHEGQTRIFENWIYEDGSWWYVPNRI